MGKTLKVKISLYTLVDLYDKSRVSSSYKYLAKEFKSKLAVIFNNGWVKKDKDIKALEVPEVIVDRIGIEVTIEVPPKFINAVQTYCRSQKLNITNV